MMMYLLSQLNRHTATAVGIVTTLYCRRLYSVHKFIHKLYLHQ
jgi:hypothetical protein